MRLASVFGLLSVMAWVLAAPALSEDLQRIITVDDSEIIGEVVNRSDDALLVKIRNGPMVEIPLRSIVEISAFSAAANNRVLTLSGSTTIGDELALDLATAFLRSQVGKPDDGSIRIDVTHDAGPSSGASIRLGSQPDAVFQAVEVLSVGSSNGIDDLLEGKADFAMASRRITQQEWEDFRARYGVDMRSADAEHVIGIDAVEFIVHPTNRLSAVSRATLADIYSKQIDSWSDFRVRSSGLGAAIENLGREEGSGTADAFEAIVMAGGTPAYDRMLDSAAGVAGDVNETPAALGFVGIARNGGNRVLAIDECGIDYFTNSFLVSAEDHPLSRRLYLYKNPAASNVYLRSFVNFVLSEAPGSGQSIVDRHFVSLSLREADDEVTQWRLAMTGNQPTENPDVRTLYRSLIRDARRLSATFRFGQGQSRLDSRGERDLRALIRKVQRENIAPDRLLIFGFADAVGAAQLNIELSRSRGLVIADRLRGSGIDIPAENVIGVGEEAPIACNYRPDGNLDPWGSGRNRRIEVWIRQEASAADDELDPRKAQI